MSSRIGVCAAADAKPQAAELAAELGLPLAECDGAGFDLLLEITPEHLQMRQPLPGAGASRMGPVWCEFVEGKMGFRRRVGAEHSGLLARAVGWKREPLKVLDVTAGLGRDAFILALLGFEVTAVERSPVLYALLRDGLERAKRDEALRPIIETRLHLIHVDAREYLASPTSAQRPDVVYVDPMFPERRKSAMVKKEMVLCRLAAGEDEDAPGLLEAALATGVHRIAVKRPLHAPTLTPIRPTLTMKGTALRYDVYIRP